MRHICKNCYVSVTIPEEWVERGEDTVIRCQNCNKRVRLKLGKAKTDKPRMTASGTLISDENKTGTWKKRLKLVFSNSRSGETLMIKELTTDGEYIVGRNASRIKEVSDRAQPVVIPPNSDSAVSRAHLRLNIWGCATETIQITAEDLKSLNKTTISGADGHRTTLEVGEQVYLKLDDSIYIGKQTTIHFEEI